MELKSGTHKFPQGLRVPEEKTLLIRPGATLLMGADSRLVVEGKIIAKGKEEQPITFTTPEGEYWRGIKIKGDEQAPDIEKYKKLLNNKNFTKSNYFNSLKKGNAFIDCRFQNLKTNGQEVKENRLKAAIEAYRVSMVISDSSFENIVHMGGVKAEESLVLARNNQTFSKNIMKTFMFVESVHMTINNTLKPNRQEYHLWPEAIYTKAGVAIVADNMIQGYSDNGIDNDLALSFIFNNDIKDVYDDGIDIDNKTTAYILGNNIENTKFNSILVSNQSSAIIMDNNMSKSQWGITLRNGGDAKIENVTIVDCEYGLRLFNRVPLLLTKKDFNRVKDKFRNLSKKEIDKWGHYVFQNNQGAVDLFESSYDNHGDVYIYNQPWITHDLKNLFKTIDVFDLEDVADVRTKIEENKINDLKNYYNRMRINNTRISAKNNITARSFYSIKGSYTDAGSGQTVNVDENNIKHTKMTDLENDDKFINVHQKTDHVKDIIKKAKEFSYETL